MSWRIFIKFYFLLFFGVSSFQRLFLCHEYNQKRDLRNPGHFYRKSIIPYLSRMKNYNLYINSIYSIYFLEFFFPLKFFFICLSIIGQRVNPRLTTAVRDLTLHQNLIHREMKATCATNDNRTRGGFKICGIGFAGIFIFS